MYSWSFLAGMCGWTNYMRDWGGTILPGFTTDAILLMLCADYYDDVPADYQWVGDTLISTAYSPPLQPGSMQFNQAMSSIIGSKTFTYYPNPLYKLPDFLTSIKQADDPSTFYKLHHGTNHNGVTYRYGFRNVRCEAAVPSSKRAPTVHDKLISRDMNLSALFLGLKAFLCTIDVSYSPNPDVEALINEIDLLLAELSQFFTDLNAEFGSSLMDAAKTQQSLPTTDAIAIPSVGTIMDALVREIEVNSSASLRKIGTSPPGMHIHSEMACYMGKVVLTARQSFLKIQLQEMTLDDAVIAVRNAHSASLAMLAYNDKNLNPGMISLIHDDITSLVFTSPESIRKLSQRVKAERGEAWAYLNDVLAALEDIVNEIIDLLDSILALFTSPIGEATKTKLIAVKQLLNQPSVNSLNEAQLQDNLALIKLKLSEVKTSQIQMNDDISMGLDSILV